MLFCIIVLESSILFHTCFFKLLLDPPGSGFFWGNCPRAHVLPAAVPCGSHELSRALAGQSQILSLPGVVSVPLKPPPIPGQLGEGREELGLSLLGMGT